MAKSPKSPSAKGEQESSADKGGKTQEYRKWLTEIRLAEKHFEDWIDRSKKIVERYRDDQGKDARVKKRFNIFWSNVQTLQPALYARTPKPQVERRFKDNDPTGRVAAQVLERATDYVVSSYDFDSTMRACRNDYLIVGRGQVWIRYVPHFKTKTEKVRLQITSSPKDPQEYKNVKSPPDTTRTPQPEAQSPQDPNGQGYPPQQAQAPEQGAGMQPQNGAGQFQQPQSNPPAPQSFYTQDGKPFEGEEEPQQDEQGYYAESKYESVSYEEIICEYLGWQDYLHSPDRTENEIRWKARIAYLTKDEVEDRFGKDVAEEVAYDAKPDDIAKNDKYKSEQPDFQKATFYEVWNKPTREVLWINKGLSDFADREKDPLGLKDFFPCPKALYATTTTDSLIPLADFSLYQDQAQELDDLTGRIASLTKAIKNRGVYDASFPELQKLVREGSDDEYKPVDWARFSQSGGFEGVLQALPIKDMAAVLMQLYEAREKVKADLYEITGMSDIIRGNSDPNETATAQQIKGNFATLRLTDRQEEMQRFARDIYRIKAEIIRKKFSPKLIRLISDADELDELALEQQPDPNNPQDQGSVQFDQDTFDEAIQLLRDDEMSSFRVDVESDSMIAADESQDKQDVTDFVTSFGNLMQEFNNVIQTLPAFAPVFGEVIKASARRFRFGRSLEASIDQAILQTQQQQDQASQQPPQPDPKLIEIQANAEAKQQQIQMQAQATQSEIQSREQEQNFLGQLKAQELQSKMALQRDKMQGELSMKSEDMALRRDMQAQANQQRLSNGLL